jgi:hypothetical protein
MENCPVCKKKLLCVDQLTTTNLIVVVILKATSHTRLRARDHTLQALSLVEKAEPIQVRFTLHLRDQQSMRMQDGCEVYMDSYIAANGSCFMVT